MASRGKKFLYGCGIGCLAFIILGVGACVTFVAWLNRPGELLEPERLVGADTSGYVAWSLRAEDPGTSEFVENFLEGIQRISAGNREEIHPLVDSWITGLERRRNERQLREMFPLVAAWTLRPGSVPEDDLQLYTVSLVRAGNRFVLWDWLLGMALGFSPQVATEEHRGERIYALPLNRGRSLAFFIRGNDLFFASDVETAKRAVDRLAAEAAAEGAAGLLDDLLRSVPSQSPMRGALTNDGGELSRVWNRLTGVPGPGGPGSDAWTGFRGMTLAGALSADDAIDLELGFLCPDATGAAAQTDAVAAALRAALEPTGLPLELEARAEGNWIRADLRLSGITTRFEEFVNRVSSGR
jgi:hypothetical protein